MTPEHGKLLCKVFLDTIEQEAEMTKKVIKAVPEDKKGYQPDPKAKTAHELAWHIASSDVWFMDGVLAGQFSMGDGPAAPPTMSGIVEWYETNHRDRANSSEQQSKDPLLRPLAFLVFRHGSLPCRSASSDISPCGARTTRAGKTRKRQWAWEDLNLRPQLYQSCALTA